MPSTEVLDIIKALQSTVWAGYRTSPYVDDSQGVFRSHFDWHSSVHAHWMILSSSRFLNDKESAQKILSRLNDHAILVERNRLVQNPEFELPYGQAWLLLLLHELKAHQKPSDAVNLIQIETVVRIGKWLEENVFPEKKVDSYHSWLITYFLFKKSKSDLQYLRASLIDDKFHFVDLVKDDDDPKDFFSSESLFSILKHQPKLPFDLVNQLDQIGPITRSNCHYLGKLISQSWATPQNNSDSLQSGVVFTKEFIKRPNLWKDNFETVSHWIPQFLWCGLWQALAEP